eukprot:gene11317-4129_t
MGKKDRILKQKKEKEELSLQVGIQSSAAHYFLQLFDLIPIPKDEKDVCMYENEDEKEDFRNILYKLRNNLNLERKNVTFKETNDEEKNDFSWYLSVYKSLELSKTGRKNEHADLIDNDTLTSILQFLKDYGKTEKKKFCLFRLLSLLGQIIISSDKKTMFLVKNEFVKILTDLNDKNNEILMVLSFKLFSSICTTARNLKGGQVKLISENFLNENFLEICCEYLKDIKDDDTPERKSIIHYIFVCYFYLGTASNSEKEHEKFTKVLVKSNLLESTKKWLNCQIKSIVHPLLDLYNFIARNKTGKEFCEEVKLTGEVIELLKIERDPKLLTTCCSFISSAIDTEEVAQKYCADQSLLERLMSLILTRGYPTSSEVNFCSYGALASVVLGSTEDTITTLQQMQLLDVAMRDLTSQNLSLRYGATVIIRAVALYSDTNSSSIFKFLIESRVFDLMWNTFSADLSGKSNDPYQDWFNKRVEEFVKRATLGALNCLIQAITVDGDEKNVKYVNDLITKNEKFRELVRYLAEMEKQKKTTKSSPKFLIFLVLGLVAILVLLPIVHSRLNPKK